MAKLNLGSSDIKQLIANYDSKQRQLQFEMDRLKGTIRSLKNSLPELEKAEAEQAAIMAAAAEMEIVEIAPLTSAAKPTARRGRPAGTTKSKTGKKPKKAAPAKAAPAKAAPAKAAKKTKAAKAKDRSSGYRLSEYDQLIFDTLGAYGRAMINSDLVTHIEESKKNKGEKVEEGEVQKMVVRSLQKLANRRDDIRKVPYEGRGMAYALPEWLNGQGNIKKKHAHKA